MSISEHRHQLLKVQYIDYFFIFIHTYCVMQSKTGYRATPATGLFGYATAQRCAVINFVVVSI